MQTPKETLQYLLKGRDANGQRQLESYFAKIPSDPNILWYPSSGFDFRDILELSGERAARHNLSLVPDIFIHSDCSDFYLTIENKDSPQERKETRIINERTELLLNPEADVRYSINPKFYNNPEHAPSDPRIQLLDVTYGTKKDGLVTQKVIYFYFENNNFLEEILLKFRIGISHFVKVREGLSDFGCLMSISYVLDLLSELNTKYLIFGDGFGSDSIYNLDYVELEERLIEVYHLKPASYSLKRISEVPGWSGYKTKIYKIKYQRNRMEVGDFLTNYKELTS